MGIAKNLTQNLSGWSSRGRFLARTAALACVGAGLLLGGCNKELKDENASLMQENAQLRDANQQLSTNNSAYQQQLDAMKNNPAPDAFPVDTGGGVRTQYYGPRETVIEIAGDVLFDSGQATLKSTAKQELDRVASTIRSRHSGRTLRIVGHTDTDPIRKSKWPSNESLSQARAEAVADYLGTKGISRSMISTIGKGASEPKSTKKSSRRVEVVIVDTQ